MKANEEKLVEENIKLVGFVLKKYFPVRMDDEDLFQVGCIGLMTAAKLYDESLGYTFSTLATKVIRQAIIRAIRDEHADKRVVHKFTVSLDEILYSTGDGDTDLTRSIPDLETSNPEDEALQNISLDKIMRVSVELSQQQKVCFMEYYINNRTQRNIAKMLDIKQVTVSRELKRAAKMIRENIA